MKQVKQWQHLMFKRMVCICCAVCIALGCTSVCFASGVSGAGEVIYTNSHGADAEWIVENTAYEAEPYRWTDGTDHNIIYGFDMAEAPALSIRITVLMNYVVSISPDNVQWIEAANYGDISGGERIQSQDNETDIDIVFSEYGCTDMAYMKISNMDNAGDYGGAIKKFVLNPNQQTVDTQGLVADQIQKYSGDDLAKMAEKSATSGYPNRAAAGVEHQKGGLLYQNITTPVKEAKYDFTVGETIATNVQGADEAWIEEDKALSADPYRWTDGTDRYIIYRFDMSENPMLAVKVRVLMNYVVSVSSDKSAWTEVANWKDVAGGERIKSQANRTDVDVVFDKYGCEDIGYIKISNMDNAGDYGGAIERFTLMTAQLKNWYYVNPGDTLRAEVDVCLNDGSEGLTISVLNGDFGLKEHTVTRSEYEALEPKTTADYIDNLSYRTISIPFTMPTSESAADIAGRLQNSGFGITLAGPETGCQILGIRLVNETANAVVRDYTPSELLALAKDDSQPIPIERELKCWSALEKTIGVRDDCGPHLGTVYGAAVPFEDESGTPYYDEGDLIIITEHLYYDCDQDALPKEGPGPRTVAVNPGEYKEYADSNSVDMAEYHAMEIQQDDLYNGNPYREITFSFTIPSRSEAEIADRGFLYHFGSYIDYTQFPICLYYVEFYNVSTNQVFYSMDGDVLRNTSYQNERRENIVVPNAAGSIIASPVPGNTPSVMVEGQTTALSAGKYSYDFEFTGGDSVNAAVVSVLDNNDRVLAVRNLNTQTSSYVNQQLYFELAQETQVRFKVVYNNKISFVLKEITLNEMISEDELSIRTFIKQIDELPEADDVTIADRIRIQSAATAYEKLSDTDKQKITNINRLLAAQERLADLIALEEDQRSAGIVDKAIEELPAIENLEMPYANRIEAVRANYDRLNERAKTLVTKLETLVALEERIEYFISLGQDNIAAAQSVIDLIQALVSLDDLAYEDKESIESAKSAYDALSEQQKELIGAQTLQKLNALVDAVSNMTPSVIFGDINADTKIDTQDALMALQYSVDLIELTDEQKTAADVDANQKIDPSDALMILQATVDLIQPEDFPAVK